MRQLEKAHQDAMRLPIERIAEMLQETIGQRLTAYAIGLRDPKAIGRYARGEQRPRDEAATRLRNLYQVVRLLLARETAETVRAWLIGANPLLEDRAPIELLHEESASPVVRTAEADRDAGEGETDTGLRPVIQAAEAFVETG